MNTYLFAVYDGEPPYIDFVTARNLNEAKDRIIQKYTFEDDDVPDDWDDFIKYNDEYKGIVIGDLYEISEFY